MRVLNGVMFVISHFSMNKNLAFVYNSTVSDFNVSNQNEKQSKFLQKKELSEKAKFLISLY